MKNLTDTELLAIHYHVLSGCEDWLLLYRVAVGDTKYNALTQNSRKSLASKWKNSQDVKDEVKRRQYEQQRREEEQKQQIQNIVRETVSTEQTPTQLVDNEVNFLNRDEFLQFLNERANQITDDKQRNDILKMLSDNMRYKESENQENAEIQRFYTPILCENCEIYRRCKHCSVTDCNKML